MAVDEALCHCKGLRHAYERVVHSLVAVWMVFAQDVADDARALAEGLGRVEAEVLHRKEDAAVDRLEPVADVRQRAADDDGQRVLRSERASG